MGNITGGAGMYGGGTSKDISSASYSVLDWKATNILDPLNCEPTGGHTVSFDYGAGITWADDEAPQRAYTSPNGKIPVFKDFGKFHFETA